MSELSLTIAPGEICVLVGPSGSGKTTAMKMVNRLVDITEGDIEIDGRSVRGLDVTELRRGIGYVIQQVGLFPHHTIGENVGTVPRLLGWPTPDPRPRRRAARARRPRGRRSRALSGAALRRAAAARRPGTRARRRPTVMLMDEPFGALDPLTRARLQKSCCACRPRAQDGDLRYARHRRGDHARRPHRHPPRRRRAGPVRHARRDPGPAGRRFRGALRRRRPGTEAPLAAPARRDRARPARRPERRAALGRDDAARRALDDAHVRATRCLVCGADGRPVGSVTLDRIAELLAEDEAAARAASRSSPTSGAAPSASARTACSAGTGSRPLDVSFSRVSSSTCG